jgi:3',5'-cyclic AMP phosphodiesterase CpdA
MKRRDFLINIFKEAGLAAILLDQYSTEIMGKGKRSFSPRIFPPSEQDNFYDPEYFLSAELINRVTSKELSIHLLLNTGKKLDIKIVLSRNPALQPPQLVRCYYGVEDSLDVTLNNLSTAENLYYRVEYKEGKNNWKAHPVRILNSLYGNLEDDILQVIFIGDTHTYDDGDQETLKLQNNEYRQLLLSGDYINYFLNSLIKDPSLNQFRPGQSDERILLMNGFCLANALYEISSKERPKFIFDLGDLTGIASKYNWSKLGLPGNDLESNIKLLWSRIRKIYSALSPKIPIYLALGNHDGESGYQHFTRESAKKVRIKFFPLPLNQTHPEGGSHNQNYYAFTWGKNALGTGGALFVVLDVESYTGPERPKRPEDWTLGKEQMRWLKEVLQKSRAEWKFLLAHHVLGGWPRGSTEDKEGAYGRGPVYDRGEQRQILELMHRYDINAFIRGHDHIFSVKKIGTNSGGRHMYDICVGSTKFRPGNRFWNSSFWKKYYRSWEGPNPDFYGVPGFSKLIISKKGARIEYKCCAYSPYTNIPNAKIGETVSSIDLT